MVVMLRLITLPLLALMPTFALGSVLTDLDVRSTSGGEVELVLQFSGGVAELRFHHRYVRRVDRLDGQP